MSTIGKTFAVINLALAAIFLGFTANTLESSNNWKKKHDELETQKNQEISDLNDELASAKADRDTQATQKDQYLNEKNDAVARADRLQADLDAANTENSQLRGSVDGINSTLGDYESNNRALQTAKDEAIQARFEAENERDSANAAKDAAELAQREAEQKLATAEALIQDQLDQLAAKDAAYSKLDTQLTVALEKANLTRTEVQAALRPGEVLIMTLTDTNAIYVWAVTHGRADWHKAEIGQEAIYDVEPGMVALNVGSAGGVKIGHTFEVFRGNVYKGRVRVTHVRDGMCSALITNLVPGQTIAQGDSAETNLSL